MILARLALVVTVFFGISSLGWKEAVADQTAEGLVTQIYVHGYEENTIYFRLSPMPPGVTQWFYARSDTGTPAGCASTGSEVILRKIIDALILAKQTREQVRVRYCLDQDGYGLITIRHGFLQVGI